MQPRLHRPRRHPERRRRLGLRELQQVAALDDEPHLIAQVAERRPDLRVRLAREERVLR